MNAIQQAYEKAYDEADNLKQYIMAEEIELPITVKQTDIFRIGHDRCKSSDGSLVIVVGESYGIDIILLRNILRCFGNQYYIVNIDDMTAFDPEWTNDDDVAIITNLPFSLLEQKQETPLCKQFLSEIV